MLTTSRLLDQIPCSARLAGTLLALLLSITTGAAGATGRPGCTPDERTLCLLGSRFEVRVEWENHRAPSSPRASRSGAGHAVARGDRSGTFWFFRKDNVELVVKILDGRRYNDHFWFFYGALTDVKYSITVTDTATGAQRRYHNAAGNLCGDSDITAFDGSGEELDGGQSGELLLPAEKPRRTAATAEDALSLDTGRCTADEHTLCLLGGRLRVRVAWRNQRTGGSPTAAHARPDSDRTGFFWFSRDDNVELVVKALDGRGSNGRLWFFYGALTDVDYVLTVTDTTTGVTRSYHNPRGNLCGRGDTGAFCDDPALCPRSTRGAALQHHSVDDTFDLIDREADLATAVDTP